MYCLVSMKQGGDQRSATVKDSCPCMKMENPLTMSDETCVEEENPLPLLDWLPSPSSLHVQKFESLLEAAVDLDKVPDEYVICPKYSPELESVAGRKEEVEAEVRRGGHGERRQWRERQRQRRKATGHVQRGRLLVVYCNTLLNTLGTLLNTLNTFLRFA